MNLVRHVFSSAWADSGYVLAAWIVGSLVFLVVVLQLLNHRRRMTAMRLRTLEALAKAGALTPQQVEDFLAPAGRRGRGWLVAGWLVLAGGVVLMAAGAMLGYRDSANLFAVGLCVAFAATALLATPIMLREFKKQGWA